MRLDRYLTRKEQLVLGIAIFLLLSGVVAKQCRGPQLESAKLALDAID